MAPIRLPCGPSVSSQPCPPTLRPGPSGSRSEVLGRDPRPSVPTGTLRRAAGVLFVPPLVVSQAFQWYVSSCGASGCVLVGVNFVLSPARSRMRTNRLKVLPGERGGEGSHWGGEEGRCVFKMLRNSRLPQQGQSPLLSPAAGAGGGSLCPAQAAQLVRPRPQCSPRRSAPRPRVTRGRSSAPPEVSPHGLHQPGTDSAPGTFWSGQRGPRVVTPPALCRQMGPWHRGAGLGAVPRWGPRLSGAAVRGGAARGSASCADDLV